jgi:deazaflavin-dependent oxidoreductase (nitroreductase family)
LGPIVAQLMIICSTRNPRSSSSVILIWSRRDGIGRRKGMRSRTHAARGPAYAAPVRREREARMQNLGGRVPFLGNAVPRLHARLYRRLGGRFVGRWFGGPVAVLETTGRRSGKVRATPVIYAWDGDDVIVVASNAGNERTPAWWLNLQAEPRAAVTIGGERHEVRARETHGEERERRRRVFERVYPKLDDYGEFTAREFPVVVLEPVARA